MMHPLPAVHHACSYDLKLLSTEPSSRIHVNPAQKSPTEAKRLLEQWKMLMTWMLRKSRLLGADHSVQGYELLPTCGLERGYVNEDTNLGFTQPSISQITFKHMLSSINTVSGISCYFTGRSADNKYKDMCRSVVPVSILVPPGLQFI